MAVKNLKLCCKKIRPAIFPRQSVELFTALCPAAAALGGRRVFVTEFPTVCNGLEVVVVVLVGVVAQRDRAYIRYSPENEQKCVRHSCREMTFNCAFLQYLKM